MHYPDIAIPDERVPRAAAPALQHVLDTYASETNKVAAVWRGSRTRTSPTGRIRGRAPSPTS